MLTFHSRRRARRAAVAAAALLALAFTAGCGSDDSPSADTAAGSGTTAAAAELSGTVKWSMLDYGPTVRPWAEKVAKAFEAEHPGVTVEVTLPPVNSYQQLLTTQVRGKNPPDVAAVPTAWVPAFAQAKAIQPWTDHLDDAFLGRFEPTLLEGAKLDGELYALPYSASSRGLFWNKSAFAKAGLDQPPATWDDLIANGKAIAAKGGAKYGFALQGTGNEAFAAWFPYVYWSYGGELADADGKLAIDEQACVDGTTILDRMVDEKVTQPNVTSADLPDQLRLFASGQAAMTITGPWLIGQLATDAKEMDYGVAPLPAGTTSTTLNVQDAYVLFSDNAAAIAFAQFLFDEQNEDPLLEDIGALPVLTEGFDAPRYQEEPLKTFAELLPQGKFVPSDPGWLKLTDSGARALQAMYTDGKSPQDTCAAIAEAAGS